MLLTRRLAKYKNRLLVACFVLILSSCAIHLVSDFDKQSLQQMQAVASQVEQHFISLQYVEKSQRLFEQSKDNYIAIEVALQALKVRQAMRPLNEQTLKQVDIALDLWSKDIASHKKQNTVSDFILQRHRQQYQRLFLAMIKGEEAKKVN
ncbi:hypothetical protein [Saccharobesus litoralis]|nr:hypothetical protein [Saccharobesus litoralis]